MDYGLTCVKVRLYCDNTSTINLTKNHIQHSKTKHIERRNNFIRDHMLRGECEIKFVKTQNQLADLFTKLRTKLGIFDRKNVF